MDPFLIQDDELALLQEIQTGFPLSATPFAEIGGRLGMDEEQVIQTLASLRERGIIKRMGLVVRHRELGYRANAMVVWQVPAHEISQVGQAMSRMPCVTLCYRRRPQPPLWPYNLYCMIHGRERQEVLQQLDNMVSTCEFHHLPKEILFSRRRFKQQGARYLLSSQGTRS
ncbi:MAG: Lrp/AsnC family transcriptional regulator [Magnetococcales bacterium]|nr:AsnC family protein [Magnetococcales bacterium]NGZ25301.1 Lrp/AsnC family transcriptional regulator [Magnetococcales bacterium]